MIRGTGRTAAAAGLALALVGLTGCAPSAPEVVTVPSTSTTVVVATGLGFSDADDGRSATVAAGQRVTVILHSSEFVFQAPSDPSVLGAAGPPTVTPGGPTCTEVPGSGCGTVVANFLGLRAGDVEVRANRTRCDAPACLPDDAHWRLTVHVVDTGGLAPTTTPILPTEPLTVPTVPVQTVPTVPTTVAEPPTSGAAEVRGTVHFSPVCPVERIPPDPACAPRPGRADIALVRPDGTVAANVSAGDDGVFAIPVDPGRYVVQASVPGRSIGGGCQSEPAEVVADPGKSATVAVSCDTGIR